MAKLPRSIHSSRSTQPTISSRRQTFLQICILLAWVTIGMLISEYLVVYPLYWLIGAQITQAFWSSVSTIIICIVRIGLIVFLPHILYKHNRTNREELGLVNYPTWTDIGLAPIAFVIYWILAAILLAIFSTFSWFDPVEAQDVGINYLINPSEKLVGFAALVIAAPIAEEVIFRGWLYGKLRAKLNLPLSILIVSLLFAILHHQWNVGVNVFAMSIVLCLQREITGTIYSGILLHMLKNGVAFYFLYILGI